MKSALIVGCSEYEEPAVRDLDHADADAVAMAETLARPEYGFAVELLVNRQATRAAVLESLFRLRKDASHLLFYFAGHGARSARGTEIVLYDGRNFDWGILVDDLVSVRIPRSGAISTVLLDCCHSGQGVSRNDEYLAAASSEDIQRSLSAAPSEVAVIAACLEDEVAYEYAQLGHGLLTYNLLEGLGGLAADDGGRVTATSLYTFVASAFQSVANQHPCFRGTLASGDEIGAGLPPREVISQPADELAAAMAQAVGELDGFLARKAGGNREDRKAWGFKQDALALEPVLRWFEKAQGRYPALARNDEFSDVLRSLRYEQAYLCNLGEGLVIPGGVVGKQLGAGGFGSVWLVKGDDGAERAFKVFHSNELADKDKIGRFLTGYRANRQLSHPNIVEVFEERMVPLGFFMQAIDGPNLRDSGCSSWDVMQQLQFLILTAETLQFAHDKGVIHRDIKPENILVRWDEVRSSYEPVVSDFDLAWFTTATQRTQAAMGMALYAPPEQRDFLNTDATRKNTVDVFSFAQVAHFMLTGRDPRVNQPEANCAAINSALRDRVPAHAIDILMRVYRVSSEYDPSSRYQEFSGVLNDLREVKASVERAAGGARLEVGVFLQEVRACINDAVEPVPGNPRDFSALSRTQRTEVQLDDLHDREEACGFDFRFAPTAEFGARGLKNADLRRALNQQLDRVLTNAPVPSRRRSGRAGVYEVFVDVEPVSTTEDMARAVGDVCLRVIRTMEALNT